MVRVQLELEWNIFLLLVRRERKSRITIFVAGVTPGNEDAGLVPSLPHFQSFRKLSRAQKLRKKLLKSTLTRILRTWISVTF